MSQKLQATKGAVKRSGVVAKVQTAKSHDLGDVQFSLLAIVSSGRQMTVTEVEERLLVLTGDTLEPSRIKRVLLSLSRGRWDLVSVIHQWSKEKRAKVARFSVTESGLAALNNRVAHFDRLYSLHEACVMRAVD